MGASGLYKSLEFTVNTKTDSTCLWQQFIKLSEWTTQCFTQVINALIAVHELTHVNIYLADQETYEVWWFRNTRKSRKWVLRTCVVL
jgi:nitrate/nitrite-specific signal transduction histidine kinase